MHLKGHAHAVTPCPHFSHTQGLGDATWSLSTGIGSVMAGGMLEAGRPRRLSQEVRGSCCGVQWRDDDGSLDTGWAREMSRSWRVACSKLGGRPGFRKK